MTHSYFHTDITIKSSPSSSDIISLSSDYSDEQQLLLKLRSKLCASHPLPSHQEYGYGFSNNNNNKKPITTIGSGDCSSRNSDFYLPFDIKISNQQQCLIVADRENFRIQFFDLNKNTNSSITTNNSHNIMASFKLSMLGFNEESSSSYHLNSMCLEYCQFQSKEYLYLSFEEGFIAKYDLNEMIQYSKVTNPIIERRLVKKRQPVGSNRNSTTTHNNQSVSNNSNETTTATTTTPSKKISPIWTCHCNFPISMVVRYGWNENYLFVASSKIPVIKCSNGEFVNYCLISKEKNIQTTTDEFYPSILPYGITLIEEEGKNCCMVISDTPNNKLMVYEEERDFGSISWKFRNYVVDNCEESGDTPFKEPVGLLYDRFEKQLICLDQRNQRIKVYNQYGNKLITTITPAKSPNCYYSLQPRGLDLDCQSGLLYVADTFNHVVKVFK